MAVPFARAIPSAASRRSFLIRSASSTDGTTTSAGYTRSGRSHSRSPPDPPGDRDLAAHHQELEHLGDVAVVGPPGRSPRRDARVGDVARAQRAGAAEQVEDVAPETVVVAEPGALLVVARPVGRTGEVQADVAHRPDQRVVLEQRAVLLDGLLELGGLVCRPEAAPGDEVRAGRDRRGRVDLQQGQPLHDRRAGRSAWARRAAVRAPRSAAPAPW